MADMKEALLTLGVAPGRIHVEMLNGSEQLLLVDAGRVLHVSYCTKYATKVDAPSTSRMLPNIASSIHKGNPVRILNHALCAV